MNRTYHKPLRARFVLLCAELQDELLLVADAVEQDADTLHVDLPVVCDVPSDVLQVVCVVVNQDVEATFADLEGGQAGL